MTQSRLPSNSSNERRKDFRVNFEESAPLDAELVLNTWVQPCKILDISISGCRLGLARTARLPDAGGQLFRLRFSVSFGAQVSSFDPEIRIIHEFHGRAQKTFGVAFADPKEGSLASMRDAIWKLSMEEQRKQVSRRTKEKQ